MILYLDRAEYDEVVRCYNHNERMPTVTLYGEEEVGPDYEAEGYVRIILKEER